MCTPYELFNSRGKTLILSCICKEHAKANTYKIALEGARGGASLDQTKKEACNHSVCQPSMKICCLQAARMCGERGGGGVSNLKVTGFLSRFAVGKADIHRERG